MCFTLSNFRFLSWFWWSDRFVLFLPDLFRSGFFLSFSVFLSLRLVSSEDLHLFSPCSSSFFFAQFWNHFPDFLHSFLVNNKFYLFILFYYYFFHILFYYYFIIILLFLYFIFIFIFIFILFLFFYLLISGYWQMGFLVMITWLFWIQRGK